MKIGQTGTYVLAMDQTQWDGVSFGDLAGQRKQQTPQPGQQWSWSGQPVRLDGPTQTLLLQDTIRQNEARSRVQRRAQRCLGRTMRAAPQEDVAPLEDTYLSYPRGFVVSDGRRHYTLVPIHTATGTALWCADGLPDCGRRFEVIRAPEGGATAQSASRDDVICFTRGTLISTACGPVPVEDLRPGDKVLTRDDGPQDVLWIGQRHVCGARLYVAPHLRPVRIRAKALGPDQPDADLLVSPHHQVLVATDKARAAFGAHEVLVAAHDLIDHRLVYIDRSIRKVDYFHLLLPRHAVLWANGVPSESYHPASTSLETVAEDQRAGLLDLLPDLEGDLHSYGPYARRNLTAPEAAILMGSDMR